MRATVLALAATRAATDCPMSVTVDGTAYTYDLDDQWRSVRWDLFAARTMVAPNASPNAFRKSGSAVSTATTLASTT